MPCEGWCQKNNGKNFVGFFFSGSCDKMSLLKMWLFPADARTSASRSYTSACAFKAVQIKMDDIYFAAACTLKNLTAAHIRVLGAA